MSGSIAAIAAYNGTGTQGYHTTDKTIPGVKSIFFNEDDTDKYYVNGSTHVEVSSNISEVNFNRSDPVVFTFGNEFDAVSDFYLKIRLTNPSSTDYDFITQTAVDSIQLCIGNQIIVTQNATQFFYSEVSNLSDTANQINNEQNSTFVLSFFSTYIQNFAYLTACANNQTLQLKIFPSTKSTLNARGITGTQWETANFSLFARVYSMVNDERNFLRNSILPKLCPITQYSQDVIIPTNPGPNNPIIVNCDNFNLDATAISIVFPRVSDFNRVPFNVELYLNNISYFGTLPYSLGIQFAPGEDWNFFVLPLSLSATMEINFYKSDFVPLSKFDYITVKIYYLNSTTYNQSQIDILNNGLTVFANGYCTALYQNGAVTFNNF